MAEKTEGAHTSDAETTEFDEDFELQMSPSKWCKRLSPESIVGNHINTLAKMCELRHPDSVVKYGESDETSLHVFEPPPTTSGKPSRPFCVYVHGGYWQALDVASSGFFADSVNAHGFRFVALGYDLAPKVSLDEIVNQVRRGFAIVLREAAKSGTWAVAVGHSAGGQLVSMLMLTEWQCFGLDSQQESTFRGVFPISGVFNLLPLLRTSVNIAVKMNDAEARRNSPLLLIQNLPIQKTESTDAEGVAAVAPNSTSFLIRVAVAENDSPEFRRQSAAFASECRRHGFDASLEDVGGTDHFDITERLVEADFQLTKSLIEWMQTIDSLGSRGND